MNRIVLSVLLTGLTCAFVRAIEDSPAEKPAKGGLAYHQGLIAHYYQDPVEWNGEWKSGEKPTSEAIHHTFHRYSHSRIEPHINHLTLRKGWFSIKWTGFIKIAPAQSDKKDDGNDEGEHEITFSLWMDDGARMFIDGKKVVEDWNPRWEEALESHRDVQVKLTPGMHRLVVEYFQGDSLTQKDRDPAKLFWSCKSLNIPEQLVPASHLFHTAAELQDVEPSQGFSKEDQERLKAGKLTVNPLGKGKDPWATSGK